MTRRRVDNTAASAFHTGGRRRSSVTARAERRKHRARIKPYQHRSIFKRMYSHIVCVARSSRDARPHSALPVRQHHERRLRLILRDVDSVSKGHCLWHAPHGRHGAHGPRGTQGPEPAPMYQTNHVLKIPCIKKTGVYVYIYIYIYIYL